MKRVTAIAAIVLTTVSAGFAASAAAGEREERSTARMLQRLERDFDRESLEGDTQFRGEAGETRAGVRCATRPVTDFEQQFIAAAVAESVGKRGSAHRTRHLVIPVQFHILRKKSGAWDLTDEQIGEQMDILNRSFAPHGFSFRLDGVSRRNRTKFAKKCYKAKIEKKLKKKYAVDPAKTLNIYSCRPSQDILGYAYYPSDFPEDDYMHGVVLLYSSFPGGSAAPYDLGDTAVHEVGHYLGLFHTFEGKCGKKGDRIDDTPREKSPAFGCETGRDTCSHEGLDPIHNFMDYSDDACVEEFTADQAARMLDQVITFKPSLGGL